MYFSYVCPVHVEFGDDVASRIGPIAKLKGYKRMLVVTDQGIIKAGLAKPILRSLEENKIEYVVFDKVTPNPKDTTVEAGLQMLKEEQCDAVAAIGGGSSLDVAKVVAMLATNSGNIRDYEIHGGSDLSEEKVKEFPLPLFAIPTTAGTGSEVDFWAVITNTDTKFKMLTGQAPLYPGGPYMGATVALMDPLMTLSLSPRQTAATGIDAFFHAVEAFVSPITPLLFQSIALDAAEIAANWLVKAYKDGKNREARENMMLAAHMGGICISFGGLGAIHAFAEAVGGLYENVPHGYALAAVSSSILKYNSSILAEKYCRLEKRIHPEDAQLTHREASERFLGTISSLIEAVNLPSNLRTLSVRFEDLPEIANRASMAIEMTSDPRGIKPNDIIEMLKGSY